MVYYSDMEDHNTQTDFTKVKEDVGALMADVASWIKGSPADAQKKWDETRPVLEAKLAAAHAEAEHVRSASVGAAGEMGKGLSAALEELKKSYSDAKTHFDKGHSAQAE